MLITSHVFAGALVGSRLGPAAGLAAGFATHLLMDALPHWGVHGDLPLDIARRDGVIGLAGLAACAAAASPARRLGVLAGMAGACLPDTDKIGEHFVGRSPWPARFDSFHARIQREAPHRMPYEIAIAAALGACALRAVRRAA